MIFFWIIVNTLLKLIKASRYTFSRNYVILNNLIAFFVLEEPTLIITFTINIRMSKKQK